MFDLHVPASMAALPGRVRNDMPVEERFPHGDAHAVKRTHAERLEQMRARYWAKKSPATIAARG